MIPLRGRVIQERQLIRLSVLLRVDRSRLYCAYVLCYTVSHAFPPSPNFNLLFSETRNRSYVELDEMFEAKIPARHFDKHITSIDRARLESSANTVQQLV